MCAASRRPEGTSNEPAAIPVRSSSGAFQKRLEPQFEQNPRRAFRFEFGLSTQVSSSPRIRRSASCADVNAPAPVPLQRRHSLQWQRTTSRSSPFTS